MQVYNLIEATVAYDQHKCSVVHLNTVLNQNPDAIVDLLLHRSNALIYLF